MAVLTRLGLGGPSAAYPGFSAKAPIQTVPAARYEFDLVVVRRHSATATIVQAADDDETR